MVYFIKFIHCPLFQVIIFMLAILDFLFIYFFVLLFFCGLVPFLYVFYNSFIWWDQPLLNFCLCFECFCWLAGAVFCWSWCSEILTWLPGWTAWQPSISTVTSPLYHIPRLVWHWHIVLYFAHHLLSTFWTNWIMVLGFILATPELSPPLPLPADWLLKRSWAAAIISASILYIAISSCHLLRPIGGMVGWTRVFTCWLISVLSSLFTPCNCPPTGSYPVPGSIHHLNPPCCHRPVEERQWCPDGLEVASLLFLPLPRIDLGGSFWHVNWSKPWPWPVIFWSTLNSILSSL